MSVSNKKGQGNLDIPPPNYAPPNAYAPQQGYAGANQPYVPPGYPQPQPVQNYGSHLTTIQNTSVPQPAPHQVVRQRGVESPTTKNLNLASAILSGIVFGITMLALIVRLALVTTMNGYYYLDEELLHLSGIIASALLLLIGMILSCVTAFSHRTNKRGMIIGAIVVYCLAVCMLVLSGVLFIRILWIMMLTSLMGGCGSLALAIMSGVACSMYGRRVIVYGGVTQPMASGMVISGGSQSVNGIVGYGQPQQVVGNHGQPGYGQTNQGIGNPGQPGIPWYGQANQMVGNPGQAGVSGYGQPQQVPGVGNTAPSGIPGYEQSQQGVGNPEQPGITGHGQSQQGVGNTAPSGIPRYGQPQQVPWVGNTAQSGIPGYGQPQQVPGVSNPGPSGIPGYGQPQQVPGVSNPGPSGIPGYGQPQQGVGNPGQPGITGHGQSQQAPGVGNPGLPGIPEYGPSQQMVGNPGSPPG